MNILVFGILWSGSSAAFDLIREFEGVGYVPEEFNDFRGRGMIGDHVSSKVEEGVKDRLSEIVLTNDWKGFTKTVVAHASEYDIVRKILSVFPKTKSISESEQTRRRHIITSYYAKKIVNSQTKSKKIIWSRKYIQRVKKRYAKDKKFILFDQPIYPNRHQKEIGQVFEPFMLVAVYRNPADQVAEIIRQHRLHRYICNPLITSIYGHGKTPTINFYIDYINSQIGHIKDLKKRYDEHMVVVKFEDLVEQYDKTKNTLIKNIGIRKSSHVSKFCHFDPDESRGNINIKNNILSKKTIEYIENAVSVSRLSSITL